MPVGGGAGKLLRAVFHPPVGHEPLEAADAHRLPLDAAHAPALALVLLRAHPSADGGQRIGQGDLPVSAGKIPLRHLRDELRNPYVDRAARDARPVFAVEAALRLVHRHLGGIAERDLFKVLVAHVGGLLRHGVLL